MKKRNLTKFFVMMLAVILLTAAPVFSEEKKADNMQIVIEKIRADKKLTVAQTMELTESEAKAFWPIYEEYQKGLRKLGNRSLKLIETYAMKYGNMTNEDAKGLLNEYMTIERDRLKQRESYLPQLRKALPEIKVFRYFQLENKIQAAINAVLAEHIPVIK